MPIPRYVKLRTSTLDRIAAAYAEAVADGDFEAAEGWVATAVYVAGREADRAALREGKSAPTARVGARSRRRSSR